MSQISTINAEQFKECVFFSLSIRKPGNRAKVRDMAKLEEYLKLLHADGESTDPAVALPPNFNAAKTNGAVKVTKRLLMRKPQTEQDPTPDPYESTCSYLNERKEQLVGNFGKALPSKIKEGLFVVRKDLVQEFEDKLREALAELESHYIPLVAGDYEDAKNRAKDTPVKQGGLGPLYREADYPTCNDFCRAFGLEWQWLALGVPDDLPAALRAEAQHKLETQFAEAAEEVKLALRASFQELIAHATDKLTIAPGEKPKVFRDTLIENIHSFIETFQARNIMNDQQLAGLVDQARIVLMGKTGDGLAANQLRKFANVREETRAQFAEIQKQLDGMIETQATRRFNLSED
jgi:hypothetical protein